MDEEIMMHGMQWTHWHWTEIVRDTLIVFALTFLGSLLAGILGPQTPDAQLYTLAATNLAFTAIGFAVSGALARYDRFAHLWKVALTLWLLSLLNVVLVGASLPQWLMSAAFIAVAMGVGGALSYVVVPRHGSSYA